MTTLHYSLIAIATLLVLVGLIYYFFFFGSKYYIINLILDGKKFKEFKIVGIDKREKRKLIKTGDGRYLMRSGAAESFVDCVKAADLQNVCFKSRGFAKQVVGNMLLKRTPSASETKAKPAKKKRPDSES